VRLDYLVLENYRRFRKLEIGFPSGVTAILGRNGSGKSTLMEAVAWALYGNKEPIARVGRESIRFTGAAPGDPVMAELGFELDAQRYTVRREMRGTTLTSRASVSLGGETIAEGTESVNRFIIGLLGLDYQGFFASVFAKQKELNALSSEDAAERRRLIIRMLGIDSIDRAVQEMGGDLRELKTRIEERRGSIYDEEGHLRRRVLEGDLEKHVDHRETQIFSLGRKREELLEQKALAREAEEGFRAAEERKKRYEQLTNEIEKGKIERGNHDRMVNRLEGEIGSLEAAGVELGGLMEEISALSPMEAELREMERAREGAKRRGELKEHVERLTKDRTELVEELRRLRIDGNLDEIRGDLRELEASFDRERDEKDEMASERAALAQEKLMLERDLDRYEKRLREIRRLGDTSLCPTCERPLKEAHPLLLAKYDEKTRTGREVLVDRSSKIAELDSIITGKGAKMREVRARRDLIKKQLEAVDRKASRAAAVRERLRHVNETMDDKKRELAELDDTGYDPDRFGELKAALRKLESLRARSIKLEADRERIPRLNEELRIELEARERMTEQLGVMDTERRDIGYDAEEYRMIGRTRDELRARIGDIKVHLGKTEAEVAFLGREADRLRKEIERLRGMEDELGELEENMRYLDRLRELTKDFRRSLISRIRPVLSSISSGYFAELTDGRYSRIEVDEKYDILVYDGSEVYPLSRFSGGEEDLANLCLRLAVSSIIASSKKRHGLRFIVLDEVFGSQDSGRRRNILTALGHLLTRFEQVFIITHIDQVRDHIGNVINVEENDEGGSTAVLMSE